MNCLFSNLRLTINVLLNFVVFTIIKFLALFDLRPEAPSIMTALMWGQTFA